jgi:ATP-binding cassette subfamily B protein
MLSWPMIAFGWVTNMLQRGMASWKRMLEVLDTVPAITDARGPGASTLAIRGAIEFRDLSFSYGGTEVLKHVSAHIAADETVAIVGVTGSGKSTLISLLARLHDPPTGTVFIDGVDVRDLPLATLRSAIGFVPQEPFLFSDTLADNVAFGLDAMEGAGRAGAAGGAGRAGEAGIVDGRSAKPSQSRRSREAKAEAERNERIQAAAAVARLDKDVADFPKGYETMVGERGITLSGGQKQRTALARAIVIDPRILILDDALSAVDTYTEEEILSRLKTMMRGRTSIIVSHRISTVRGADRIFVLDGGRIVEQGSHD